MCALLVGLLDVVVLGIADWPGWMRIVTMASSYRARCCGLLVHRQGVREVELVDLPVSRPAGPVGGASSDGGAPTCRRGWTEQDPQIASSRGAITTRAAVSAHLHRRPTGRSVAEVVSDLGCDWHPAMDRSSSTAPR
jgi:hypothetical protein